MKNIGQNIKVPNTNLFLHENLLKVKLVLLSKIDIYKMDMIILLLSEMRKAALKALIDGEMRCDPDGRMLSNDGDENADSFWDKKQDIGRLSFKLKIISVSVRKVITIIILKNHVYCAIVPLQR